MTAAPFHTTAGFVARFVEPLLGGGVVEVGAPMSSAHRQQMLADASPLLSPSLLHLRTRAAQRLVAEPLLPDPGGDELSLWLGLHDVLALDHPDTERVWTRAKTWRRVENETRALLAFARPTDIAEAMARHLAVGAFLELRREDTIVGSSVGAGGDGIERRYRGQQPPRRRFGLFTVDVAEVRSETVRWLEVSHRPAVRRLLPDVMWVSPLTALLRPGWAPPGWSPLMAAGFLRSRAHARAICHAWAREREWLRIGGVVAGSLLRSLDLVSAVFGSAGAGEGPEIPGTAPAMQAAMQADRSRDPDDDDEPSEAPSRSGLLALPAPALERDPLDIGAVIGALIHLHLLKVLEFDARISIGLGARDWAVQSFLALPLLLPALAGVLGRPLDEQGTLTPGEEALARRWEEYREHLAGLVPRPVVDNLLATLVRRVVERQPA